MLTVVALLELPWHVHPAEVERTVRRQHRRVQAVVHQLVPAAVVEHVQARRRRFTPPDPQRSMEVTTRFFAAASTGDMTELMALLAPDVVWTADSNGKVSAARRPIEGAGKVAKLVLGLMRLAGPDGRAEPALYNNAPALVLYLGDHLEGVISVEVVNGRITNFYAMRNPEKLAGVTVARRVRR